MEKEKKNLEQVVNDLQWRIDESKHNTWDQLLSNFSERESWWSNGEYLKLYERQNQVAEALRNWWAEHNIKDKHGNNPYFANPWCLSFDDDVIVLNSLRNVHFIKDNNWSFEEIPLLADKLRYNDTAIREVYKVWDYYLVDLCHLSHGHGILQDANWKDMISRYVVNKKWKCPIELWDQNGDIQFFINQRWKYEVTKWWKWDKVWHTIYDKNMEKIAEFEDVKWLPSQQKYNVEYCDDEVCICTKREHGPSQEYAIFDKNWLVVEGTRHGLDLILYKDNFEKYLNEKKEKEERDRAAYTKLIHIPFEERYMSKNHCKIVYNNDEQTDISINNDKSELLYHLWEVTDKHFDESVLEFTSKEWEQVRINNRKKDNNILFIEITNYKKNTKKSIFVDKTTWEKKEFDGFKWENSSLNWKLIEVFVTGNKSEIYDDHLNLLWTKLRSRWNMYAVVTYKENGAEQRSLYSEKTWKKLCEIWLGERNAIVPREYRDENWNEHYIVIQKGGASHEVTP